jgi:hypothetical protein
VSVLVHIGYHKTGTNWLQHDVFSNPAAGYAWLGQKSDDPVRRFVNERPFEFDATVVRGALEERIRAVEAQGLYPVVSLERLSGHPFSGGHDAPQIADRLRAVLPEGRILIVIREQRSMIVATYKQYVKAGGAGTLVQFLKPRTDRAAAARLFDFRFFEYEHLIGYYRSLFSPDDVLVLPYEGLTRDGRGFVEAIAGFAGRPVPGEVLDRLPYGTPSNPSPSALTIEVVRRLNRLTPRSELDPAPIVEWRRARRLAERLKTDAILERGPMQVPAERAEARLRRMVDELVGERYRESNRATAELTGLDLGSYGWPV